MGGGAADGGVGEEDGEGVDGGFGGAVGEEGGGEERGVVEASDGELVGVVGFQTGS